MPFPSEEIMEIMGEDWRRPNSGKMPIKSRLGDGGLKQNTMLKGMNRHR